MSSGINSKLYGYVNRRSIRLKGYDYSKSGSYFITICAHDRQCLFGDVVGAGSEPAPIGNKKIFSEFAKVQLNEFGEIILDTWFNLTNHNDNIKLDEFIIMPNHVHGIIMIMDNSKGICFNRAGLEPAPTKQNGLSEIIRQFKTFSAKRINKLKGAQGKPVWQRNYYERIIRNEKELNIKRKYIINNPINWAGDDNNPGNKNIDN